jgi:hypothetical protein
VPVPVLPNNDADGSLLVSDDDAGVIYRLSPGAPGTITVAEIAGQLLLSRLPAWRHAIAYLPRRPRREAAASLCMAATVEPRCAVASASFPRSSGSSQSWSYANSCGGKVLGDQDHGREGRRARVGPPTGADGREQAGTGPVVLSLGLSSTVRRARPDGRSRSMARRVLAAQQYSQYCSTYVDRSARLD